MSVTPKIYLKEDNFIFNQNKLTISTKDNIIIVCLTSDTCTMCKKNIDNIYNINLQFPQINFSIVSLQDNPNLITKFKKFGIELTRVPTFALFKIGIFDRLLNISLTIQDLKNELQDELNANIKPKPILNNYR